MNLTPVLCLLAAAPAVPPFCPCPCPRPADQSAGLPGAGLPTLVHLPRPEAFALNREGRELYRQRRFAEARARYQAAQKADPGFLGPRLNLACALTQEQRFVEAVEEASALALAGFVPWGREIREAADLAPLAIRPERLKLQASLEKAASAWGQDLGGSLLFLARIRPPVKLPAQGVLYLGLEQEIFAYLPHSGRYRQVTAEDGRLLGFLRSPDGNTVAYLRAGKLIRGAGGPGLLRAVSIRTLDLPTMALGPPAQLPGDAIRLELSFHADGRKSRIDIHTAAGASSLTFDGSQLRPTEAQAARPLPPGAPRLQVTGQGVRPQSRDSATHQSDGCRFTARTALRPAQPPSIVIQAAGKPGARIAPFLLNAPHGAGLQGLPFPGN